MWCRSPMDDENSCIALKVGDNGRTPETDRGLFSLFTVLSLVVPSFALFFFLFLEVGFVPSKNIRQTNN